MGYGFLNFLNAGLLVELNAIVIIPRLDVRKLSESPGDSYLMVYKHIPTKESRYLSLHILS